MFKSKSYKCLSRHLSVLLLSFTVILSSCVTTKDMEKEYKKETEPELEGKPDVKNQEELEQRNEMEMHNILVAEEEKVQDIEDTVVFIDRPVYVPVEESNPELERGNLSGIEAVRESLKRATVKPEQYKMGTFFYQYNENLVYEVYAQPFHLTDIVLEKGEVVQGTPLFSEDESVWELTAGVAIDPDSGEQIQHLFIKPAYSAQDSTLIVITDRRVYHFRVKSYAQTHMAIVRFTYPMSRNQWARKKDNKAVEIENDYIRITNPEFLSFDYKMKYSMWRKPEFLPKRVYDDGATTYIQVDDIVLQKKLPVIFNERNEIVNYSVKKNVFVIPRLINKVTLRLGREKVTVTKKKISQAKADKIQQESDSAGVVNGQ